MKTSILKKKKLIAVRLATEHEEQTKLFIWRDETMKMQTDPRLKLALRWTHAIPNGYYKSMNMRMKAKREGVMSGILDVLIPSPEFGKRNAEYHGLYIEMKRTGGKVSDNQRAFMDYLDIVHYKHGLCFFWQEAAQMIVDYLGLSKFMEIGIPEWHQMKMGQREAKVKLKKAA